MKKTPTDWKNYWAQQEYVRAYSTMSWLVTGHILGGGWRVLAWCVALGGPNTGAGQTYLKRVARKSLEGANQ